MKGKEKRNEYGTEPVSIYSQTHTTRYKNKEKRRRINLVVVQRREVLLCMLFGKMGGNGNIEKQTRVDGSVPSITFSFHLAP